MKIESGLSLLKILQNHRSVRKFKKRTISNEHIRQIVTSAQGASSSSHGQAYSIIGVTDPQLKKKLAEYAGGQVQVEQCSHFFVFCADLNRLASVAQEQGVDMNESLESTEMFLIATIDAALIAQNTAVAAEALGLGIVYTGGLRNKPYEVTKLLGLPQFVYPVFGMCIGYPEEIPDLKPRLPIEAIYFENSYRSYEETKPFIDRYDDTMRKYYMCRTTNNRQDNWTQTMTNKRKQARRLHMKKYLHEQGFPLN